jgi:hypothetical protein
MGRIGRQRIVDELAWSHQEQAYLRTIDSLARLTRPPVERSGSVQAEDRLAGVARRV